MPRRQLKVKQMHEPPYAFVSHKTGTRIRLRVPSRRKDTGYFASLRDQSPAVRGLRSIETNPLTGSVLLLHSSDPDHIIQTYITGGFFRLGNSSSTHANLQGRISETFDRIDVALRDVSGNELDIGGTAFLFLLALGGYQIIRGNIIAIPWYAAGWYALNIFSKSNTGTKPAK